MFAQNKIAKCVNNKNATPLKGFTLTELMLTFGIILFISVLLFKTIFPDVQQSKYVSITTKNLNVMNQAISVMAASNKGTVANLGTSAQFLNTMRPYLSYSKVCINQPGVCFPSSLKNLDNSTPTTYTDTASLLLNNGISISVSYDSTCSTNIGSMLTCGKIIMDADNLKGPSTWGKDVYGFWILPDKVKPYGVPEDTTYASSSCAGNGQGCAYPYIYNITPVPPPPSCVASTTIGQTCSDNTGIPAFYAGTCTPDTDTNGQWWNGSIGALTTPQAPSYYLAQGRWKQMNYGGVNELDPTCTNGDKKLYVSGGTQAKCTAVGGTWDTANNECTKLNWTKAKSYCTGLGSGWQLPSQDEMQSFYHTQQSTGYGTNNFANDSYWSSTFFNNWPPAQYWALLFDSNTLIARNTTDTYHRTRCVKVLP